MVTDLVSQMDPDGMHGVLHGNIMSSCSLAIASGVTTVIDL